MEGVEGGETNGTAEKFSEETLVSALIVRKPDTLKRGKLITIGFYIIFYKFARMDENRTFPPELSVSFICN